jgi:ketosteroid isomerase-like protein
VRQLHFVKEYGPRTVARMSAHKDLVGTYFDGFRRSDHELILGCLTEDVVWDLPGFRHLAGKEEFDGEIENEAFEGRPSLTVDRLVEEGDAVVAVGTGEARFRTGDVHRFAFCDVFTFTGDLISRVESYLVPLEGSGTP